MVKLYKIAKDYTLKSGVVHALVDINLELPEHGMIFILGKSGCGKSTLLNILGGIDTYSAGDMSVNGVSTRAYDEKAWDDYRNNEVGFIFQEYNLIDEYNIKRNIAIAGQLQGQDKKTINDVIKKALFAVNLPDYENRKTSELSGGEKQRIAIARAIAKDTTIILADEPTGNLDHKNSKEIMELLKKISKEKLVIVVSHDEETAKLFADRIIMLSDGKIISDELNYIEKESQDISNETSKFDKSNDNSNREDSNQYNFTKKMTQHISLLNLTQLSLANLWKKKWRMFIAIVLCFFSLTLFGIGISALRYNSELIVYTAYDDYDLNEIKFEKSLDVREENRHFTNVQFDKIQQQYPERVINKIYYFNLSIENAKKESQKFRTCAVITPEVLSQYGYKLLDGSSMPTNGDEVCVSKYIADIIIAKKLIENCASYADLIGQEILLQSNMNTYLKVIGIVDTLADEEHQKIQDILKKKINKNTNIKDAVEIKWIEELKNSLTDALLVGEEFIYTSYNYRQNLNLEYTAYNSADSSKPTSTYFGVVYPQRHIGNASINNIVFAEGHSSIEKNEIVVTKSVIEGLVLHLQGNSTPTESDISQYLKEGLYISSAKILTNELEMRNQKNYGFFDFKIVGYYPSVDNSYNIISDQMFDTFQREKTVTALNTKFINDKKSDMNFLSSIRNGKYNITVPIERLVGNADEMMDIFSIYGTIFASAFGIFSALMMVNLITYSIKTNKKQIGVLRALGMRSKGVVYIFLMEALTIGVLSFLVALIAIFPISVGLMNIFSQGLVTLKYLQITIVEIVIMFLFSMFISIVSSVIPILKKAKAAPVKLIKE